MRVPDPSDERRCAPGLRPTVPRESRGGEDAVGFPVYRGGISYLITEQMIEDFSTELVQIMNAGRALPCRVRYLGVDPREKRGTQ